MDEKHQDIREKKQKASELWVPSSFNTDEAFGTNGRKLAGRGARKKGRVKWGFANKAVWDWFLLLSQVLGAIAIPFVILVVGLYFTQQNTQQQVQFAADQQQETTLQTYLDDMSNLLLNNKLLESKPGDEIRQVARERTLTTLRRLHEGRNRIVLQFLQVAHLIGIQDAVINLSNADLSNDDLSGATLSGADLSNDDLSGADLSGATLSNALLIDDTLSYAIFTGAHLTDAHLTGAELGDNTLSIINMSGPLAIQNHPTSAYRTFTTQSG